MVQPGGFHGDRRENGPAPGGSYHYGMRTPDWAGDVGQVDVPRDQAPERLVLVNSFSDAAGGITRHPMAPTWPLEMQSTTTFAEQGGKTTLTLEWLPINASRWRSPASRRDEPA